MWRRLTPVLTLVARSLPTAPAGPILEQASAAAVPIAAAVALLSVGSLFPILQGSKAQGMGPFTSDAETMNGRTAVRALVNAARACVSHVLTQGQTNVALRW